MKIQKSKTVLVSVDLVQGGTKTMVLGLTLFVYMYIKNEVETCQKH